MKIMFKPSFIYIQKAGNIPSIKGISIATGKLTRILYLFKRSGLGKGRVAPPGRGVS